jgi:hypothetical protein
LDVVSLEPWKIYLAGKMTRTPYTKKERIMNIFSKARRLSGLGRGPGVVERV